MPLLKVRELSKNYGGLMAVKNVNFDVNEGEIVGIIGPNGAGKTTLFNLISGFLVPLSGVIEFRGENIVGLKPYQICKKGIGRTFQIVKPFLSMSVLENVMVGAFFWTKSINDSKQEAAEALELVGLSFGEEKPSKNLTYTDRKKLELARALAGRPNLLLLDEFAAGLNPKETEEIMSIVKEVRDRGITILAIEHVMRAIMKLSDRIIVLHHGEKIAEGIPTEIGINSKVIEAYLGESYQVA